MLTGAHVTIFAEDAEAARAFFEDVLELDAVDAGGGWLIFALPPSEVAFHPTEPGTHKHELYLMCDDIEATLDRLRQRGATIAKPATDEGFGLLAQLDVPGAGRLGLYEPRHPRPDEPT